VSLGAQRPDAFAAGPAAGFALAMAISGTVGLFAKESGVGAVEAVWWRCAFGFLAMAAWCGAAGLLSRPSGGLRDVVLTAAGGICIVANWVLVFEALRHVSITMMTIAYHVQPFFVLGMVRVAYGERTRGRTLGWVAAAFAGLALAVGFDPGLVTDPRAVWTGLGLTVVAALLYAGAVVAARGIRATRPEMVTLAHAAIGTIALAPLASVDPGVLASPSTAGWLVGLGVLHTGVVYVLMYGALPRLRGAAVAVLTFLNPVAAIVVDALVYGTEVTSGQLAGLALVAAAILAVQRP